MQVREITHQQMTFYYFDKIGLGHAVMLCGGIVIPRPVYESDLQRAANEIFRINDILRARFIEKDGKVYQETPEFMERKFEVLRFSSKEEMDEYGHAYASVALKLDVRSEGAGCPKEMWQSGSKPSKTLIKNTLLLNAKLTRMQLKYHIHDKPGCCEIKLVQLPGACGVIVKMHHIVSDAWTMSLVANQFVEILNGKTPKAYSYDEYIAKHDEYLKSKRYQRDAAFLEEQLSRCEEDTPIWNRPMETLEAKRYTLTLSDDLSQNIKEYTTQHNTSPFTVAVAAIVLFASRKLNRDSVFLGQVAINRTGVRERNTAGIFTNSAPVLFYVDKESTFSDFVTYVNETNIAVMHHQKGKTAYEGIARTPYDLWVSYQIATIDADSTVVSERYYGSSAANLKVLTMEDRANEGKFKFHLDANIGQVTQEDADEFFCALESIMKDGIANDGKAIEELGK